MSERLATPDNLKEEKRNLFVGVGNPPEFAIDVELIRTTRDTGEADNVVFHEMFIRKGEERRELLVYSDDRLVFPNEALSAEQQKVLEHLQPENLADLYNLLQNPKTTNRELYSRLFRKTDQLTLLT